MDSKELTKVVAKAKKKDTAALEQLYSNTHEMAYFTAMSILKNGQDALDVVQDSYITAFSKLDELQDNDSFVGWLKKIVANNCKNILKRKNPMLFNSNEEEKNILENIEEPSEDFLPASYIEQSVKREEVMHIINELSEVQKATILLFYYDELSIHEISKVMDCTESTVTSRISYAKKHIKLEVEKLEKKGDKLYTMTVPIPFLRRLFIEESKDHVMPEAMAKAVFNNAMAASTMAGAGSVASMVGTVGLFTKVAALGTLGKCVVAGVAATVIVGGSVAGVALKNNYDKHAVQTMATVSSSSPVSSISSSEATVSSKQLTASNDADAKQSTSSTVTTKPSTPAKKPATSSSTPTKKSTPKSTTKKPVKKPASSTEHNKYSGNIPVPDGATLTSGGETSAEGSTTMGKGDGPSLN